ncbi:MAG: alpha/beta hydrolase [Oceanicaulis sp.]
MAADPNQFQKLFDFSRLTEMFGGDKSTTGLRDLLARARDFVELPPPPVEKRLTVDVAGGNGPIAARVYVPYGASEETPGPGLVFYHGGGFVIGSLDSYDPLCQRLAAVSGVRIVSIDYRLAPEHPYPAAVEDAFASFDAIAAGALRSFGFDPERLAVGGDSAGGNLAASVARERRGQVIFQLLLYPLLQLVQVKKDRPRWQEGPLLSAATLEEITKRYLHDADRNDPRVSPLLAEDLRGLPPCWMLAAELDPLLEEGEAYAAKLAAYGVPVERKIYNGLPHGFLNLSRVIPATVPAIETVGKALARGIERRAPKLALPET